MPSLRALAAEAPENWKPARYLDIYERALAGLRTAPVRLLELGVARGGSLELWARAFPAGRIAGIDLAPPNGDPGHRFSQPNISFHQGAQDDAAVLARVSAQVAPAGWDIVIDDCSHLGETTLRTLKLLLPRLRPGGLYCLEDWGTGYWHNWPDGRLFAPERHLAMQAGGRFESHTFGMPGLLKQLVDEVALEDIFDARNGIDRAGGRSRSAIAGLHIHFGLAIIEKAAAEPGAGDSAALS